jgi:hypothetical protein
MYFTLQRESKSEVKGAQNKVAEQSDADSFYVFIYDEEEKNQQTNFKRKKSGKGRGFETSVSSTRVLGFWCLNAGVGLKSI